MKKTQQPCNTQAKPNSTLTNPATRKEAPSSHELIRFVYFECVLKQFVGTMEFMQKDGAISPKLKSTAFRKMIDDYFNAIARPTMSHHRDLTGDIAMDIRLQLDLIKAIRGEEQSQRILEDLNKVLQVLADEAFLSASFNFVHGQPRLGSFATEVPHPPVENRSRP